MENIYNLKTALELSNDKQKIKEVLYSTLSIIDMMASQKEYGTFKPSDTLMRFFFCDYDEHIKLLNNMNSMDLMMGCNMIPVRMIINPIVQNIVANNNKRVLFEIEQYLREKYPKAVVDYSELANENFYDKQEAITKKVKKSKILGYEMHLIMTFYIGVFCPAQYTNANMILVPMYFNDTFHAFHLFGAIEKYAQSGHFTVSDFIKSELFLKLLEKRKRGLIKWMNEQVKGKEYTKNNLCECIVKDCFYRTRTKEMSPYFLSPHYNFQYKDEHLRAYQSVLAAEQIYNVYPGHMIAETDINGDELLDLAIGIASVSIPVDIKKNLYNVDVDDNVLIRENPVSKLNALSELNPYAISKITNYEEFLMGVVHIFYELMLQEQLCFLARKNALRDIEEKKNNLLPAEVKYQNSIDALTNENNDLKQQLDVLKKKELLVNQTPVVISQDDKLQNTIRALENEKKKLAEELEKLKSDNEELSYLREYYHLKEEPKSKSDYITDYEVEQFINTTYNNNLVFVGGRIETLDMLKKIFPNAKFLETSTASVDFDWGAVEKVFFFYKNMNHPLFYKVINIVREKNVPFEYIANKNLKLVYTKLKECVDFSGEK